MNKDLDTVVKEQMAAEGSTTMIDFVQRATVREICNKLHALGDRAMIAELHDIEVALKNLESDIRSGKVGKH